LQFDTHHFCRSSLTHGREGFCSSVELRWNGQESVHARAELLHIEGYFWFVSVRGSTSKGKILLCSNNTHNLK